MTIEKYLKLISTYYQVKYIDFIKDPVLRKAIIDRWWLEK
jgi:serine protease inhibitor